MGHWEQIGVENRKERERRAKWPRWRRELWRYGREVLNIAVWAVPIAAVVWAFWPT